MTQATINFINILSSPNKLSYCSTEVMARAYIFGLILWPKSAIM